MSTISDIGTMIVQTPGTCGGRPRIAGTSVSVRTIVAYHTSGETPEEMVVQIPHLTLAQVHAALAYSEPLALMSRDCSPREGGPAQIPPARPADR